MTKKKKKAEIFLAFLHLTQLKKNVFSKLQIFLSVIRIIFSIPMYLGGAHQNMVSVNKQVEELLCKPLQRAASTIIPNSSSLQDRTAPVVSLVANFFYLPQSLLITFK